MSEIPIKSQLLDILGPDTMIESFRHVVTNMLEAAKLPARIAQRIKDKPIQDGLSAIYKYVFEDGFDKEGTYTRIEDHRIVLATKRCRINLVHEDGCVSLQAVASLQLEGCSTLGYYWLAGLKDNLELDPLQSAGRLCDYVHKYAPRAGAAKSKPMLTYASQVEHLLGCDIIDELKDRDYLQRVEEEDMYYAGACKLPAEKEERWTTLADIVVSLLKRKRRRQDEAERRFPTHAHFRILYEAFWGNQ